MLLVHFVAIPGAEFLAEKPKSPTFAPVVSRPLPLPRVVYPLVARARRFPRVAVAISVLAIVSACEATERPLSTCAEILGLTADKARQALPVQIEGVVVLEHLKAAAVVVHDATGAIFVRTDHGGAVKRPALTFLRSLA